jgi:hypothetical protein
MTPPPLRPITTARALRLAIRAMRAARQRVAVDAHLYERGLAGNLPGFAEAWKQYQMAGMAIERLEGMLLWSKERG